MPAGPLRRRRGAAGKSPARHTGLAEKALWRSRPLGAQHPGRPPPPPSHLRGPAAPAAEPDGFKLPERKKKHLSDRLRVRLQGIL